MFRIKKTEEMVNRTFRMPEKLIEKMAVIAQKEGISLNNLVIQCCEYAIENMAVETEEKAENTKTEEN